MYDGKSQLLIKNPINRDLINSPMMPTMKTNADGSLTIYIQNDSPGADKEANCLPAPNDTAYLVMRLYWPKTEAPSVLSTGESDLVNQTVLVTGELMDSATKSTDWRPSLVMVGTSCCVFTVLASHSSTSPENPASSN